MRSARLVLSCSLLALLVAAPVMGGDSFLDRMKKRAQQKAEQKAGDKVDQAVDKGSDAASGAAGGTKTGEKTDAAAGAKPGAATAAGGAAASAAAAPEPTEQLKPGEGAWANYDFKPGNRVLYADDFSRDEVGDFPRGMELVEGTMEIVEWQGARWLRCTTRSKFKIVLPEVLPERYTMEFDYSVPNGEMWVYPMDIGYGCGYMIFARRGVAGVSGENEKGTPGPQARSQDQPDLSGKFVHARVMADGGYVKLYVNEKRLVNAPNFDTRRADRIQFYVDATEDEPALFGNFRIAAGGKKLYDQLAANGRVATQGIYFDTGSDRVRPESSPTLKEIAGMLGEHADLQLLIEGHTDNVGQAAANQTLSEKRAAAVRQTLIDSYGVAGERLTTQGYGSTKPVGPNDTPAGRQANRRVELVKK